MLEKPTKIAIINRRFWPEYPVIGEALLQFAEGAAKKKHNVSVIMQDHVDIKDKIKKADRGKDVHFYPFKAFTASASGTLFRAIDALLFMLWVMVVLFWVRPRRVYVLTDPPIVVPFIVMIYSKLFDAKYIYHVQDIHPEAMKVVIPINKWIYRLLLNMDSLSMRKANRLITITNQMATEIRLRSRTKANINILDNPAVSFDGIDTSKPKTSGFTYCGNAGRMQRIPLILDAIETYFEKGGKLEFTFASEGLYTNHLKSFSKKFSHFHYRGFVNSTEAAQITADYTWALLPIEDAVTRYAFPSKSSTYVVSGAKILAICGEDTSVAQWVNENQVGLVVKPNVEAIVETFFDIEKGKFRVLRNEESRNDLKAGLRFKVFV